VFSSSDSLSKDSLQGGVAREVKAGRRGKPKVPFPEGWSIDHPEFARFKDSALAHDRRYADWPAAWRNWQRSPYNKSNGSGGGGTPAKKDDYDTWLKKQEVRLARGNQPTEF